MSAITATYATGRTLVDGWLKTGDIARRDPAGLYYLVGRAKDVEREFCDLFDRDGRSGRSASGRSGKRPAIADDESAHQRALFGGRPDSGFAWVRTMIAGVTHLTMEAELKHGIGLGVDLGFELDFIDDVELPGGFEGIEGIEGSDYVLPVALLANAHGMRLEVARHRWETGRRGAYTAVFQSAPLATLGTVVCRPEIGNVLRQAGMLLDPTCVVMTTFDGEAWFDALPSGAGLAGILCYAVDVFAETEFWSSFAQVIWSRVGADAAWGSIPSPLPQAQCQWVVMHSDEVPSTYSMNDSGFPSIGIFSTAIERDLERAEAAGATLLSEPIVTTVGGSLLRVALILTPAGAPVELLADPGRIAR